MYQDSRFSVRAAVCDNHGEAFEMLRAPGTWFTGEQRLSIVREARSASSCGLCRQRKQALSPYVVDGVHDSRSDLPAVIIEVVHRLMTDSGRLTEAWFKRITEHDLTAEEYVEIVGVVATSVILDSYARGLGFPLHELPDSLPGEPSRETNPNVFDGGAWLPMLDVAQEVSDTGLPTQPNIARAMGLVPSAMALFFPVMRSHYSLGPLDLEISRSQVELIASRVSSHNQCFY